MALTFKQAFGPDAMLYRLHNTTDAPFYIKASKSLGDNPAFGRVSRDGYTAPQLYSGGDWYFNPKTNSFDYYPVAGGEPRKSISADEFGLDDPAYQIAGLATLEGKNGDSWSNYALTHNDYGGGVGSRDGVLNGAYQLRGAIGDINGYETKPSKSAWTALRDASQAASSVIGNYFLPGSSLVSSQLVSKGAQEHLNSPLGMVANVASGVTGGLSGNMANYGKVFDAATGATSGASTGAGAGAAEAAAGEAAGAAGAGAGATGAGEAAGGYFGGVGGQSAAMPGLQSFGAAAGSSAIPEIGIGSALGSSAAPSLFGAGELASLFPSAYALTAADAASAAGSAYKAYTGVDAIDKMINKAVNDPLGAAATVGKTILNNPAEIGALYSALTGGSKSETLGGSGAGGGLSSAFMNQALPTINVPAYRSAAIQGDPLRYGLGGEQQLYTDQAGNAPSPLNFTGQNFGVPFNITQPAPYTPTPIPAQTPVQTPTVSPLQTSATKTPLSEKDVRDYMAANNLPFTAEGISTALQKYNATLPMDAKRYGVTDVGAAFGMTPEQSYQWMAENRAAPVQTPAPAPTPSPAPTPAPAPAQSPLQTGLAKPALSRDDVMGYLTANNLPLSATGISNALARYNAGIGDPSKQYNINDVGAAFGYTPEQSRAWMMDPVNKKTGGTIDGCACGGLGQAIGYVEGGGAGQDDDVPANLSAGEYVFDADLVSALGDGNNAAGAKILDEFREKVRKHKRSALPHKIPPKSKPVEQYMKGLK